MSLALQTRLLRVLAESEFFRVGGQTAIRVDVRVIAATHQDLGHGAATGRFREDLYHRLNVMRIEVPPLRQRREDIRELSRFYLEQAANELGVAPKTLSADAVEALQRYDWPGNVRELVNVCRRLTVTAAGREIVGQDLPAELGGVASQSGADWTAGLSQWAEAQLAIAGAAAALDRCAAGVRAHADPDGAAPRARQTPRGREAARLGPQHADAQDQRARPRRPRLDAFGGRATPSSGGAAMSAPIISASSSDAKPSAPDTTHGCVLDDRRRRRPWSRRAARRPSRGSRSPRAAASSPSRHSPCFVTRRTSPLPKSIETY